MKKHPIILLFSGGIDSFCAYHFLDKPATLYFDVRSRYTKKELKVVLSLVPETIVDYSLDFADRELGEKAYIPFRNLLLAAQAVKYSDTIVIAGVKDDQVGDKNKEIFSEMSNILSKIEGRKISVVSPFWEMTKDEVVDWYLNQYQGDPQVLLSTISCYNPDTESNYCGGCPACFRKWCALRSNGIDLRFYNKELMQAYYNRAKNKVYDPRRNENIISQIENYRRRH